MSSTSTPALFQIDYEFTVTNSGSTDLINLQISDDWAMQFGNAFVQAIPGSVVVTNVDASTPPGANASYAGGAAENLLDGTGVVEPGQSFTVALSLSLIHI